MIWTTSEVKSRGKATFKAGYWKCVLVSFIITLVSGGLSSVNIPSNYNISNITDESGNVDFSAVAEAGYDTDEIENLVQEVISSPNFAVIVGAVIAIMIFALIISIALSAFLLVPLTVGCQRFFKEAGQRRSYELGNIAFAFSNNYMNIVKVMFIMGLKLFLWTLLLIIPGIVKSYEYRMIPYILGDEPDIPMDEAFRRSKEMMTGHKWHAFLLDLSFIGWILLGVLTCGLLLLFYVNPYIAATNADLYLTLKGAERTVDANQGMYNNRQYYNQPYNGQPYNGQPNNYRPYGGQPPYSGNRPPYGQNGPYNAPGQPYGRNMPGQPYGGNMPGQPGSQGQSAPAPQTQPDSSSAQGYTDGEYRELNADDDTPVMVNGDSSTPAFGDKRNSIPKNDSPFNTPY